MGGGQVEPLEVAPTPESQGWEPGGDHSGCGPAGSQSGAGEGRVRRPARAWGPAAEPAEPAPPAPAEPQPQAPQGPAGRWPRPAPPVGHPGCGAGRGRPL